jgi:glycosyltransferase involved in cell wall biosynthesis
LTLFCNNNDQYSYLKNNPAFSNANIIVFPNVRGKWLRSSRQFFKYALGLKHIKVDILHFSVPRFYPFFWLFPATKFVCTFHAGGDITAHKEKFILSREIYNLTAKIFYRKLDLVIAVSEHGKNEISQVYGIPKSLISVMHPGTDDIWKIAPVTEKLHNIAGRKLIVVIGRWQEYKNVQMVSNALVKASSSELDNYYFVFVGKKISANAKLIESDLSKLDKKLYETIDYLDEQAYAKIISEADLVIVPSLNEGFSHPVFDAFSLGTRVMMHKPSPAAEILDGRKGVFASDLSSSHHLITKITSAIEEQGGNKVDNQEFLKSIEATWSDITKNYVRNYELLIEKNNGKLG